MQPLKKQGVRLLCRIVVGQAGTDGCAEGFGGLLAAGGDKRLVIRQIRMRFTQERQQGKTVIR